MNNKYHPFNQKIILIGFGSIGQAILPLIFRHLIIKPEQMMILTKQTNGLDIAKEYGVNCQLIAITKENYTATLNPLLQPGDFLLNLSVDVSSIDLIALCQQNGALYLDTCIEPWVGGYTNGALSASARSNYALRAAALKLRKPDQPQPTAVLTHGANPGLVSSFVKQALLNIAQDTGEVIEKPNTQLQWALLANQL